MAKETLLDIVQDLLSESDGDEVNSITDTIESDQAARVVRDTFRQIVDGHDLAHHETVKRLDATGASTPNQMTRPEGFYAIEWVKYDKRTTAGGDPKLEEVTYMDPERFIAMTSSRTESDTEVTAVALASSGHEILVRNDQAPNYWTILEGYDTLVFDAYDSSLETNLQQSKVLAKGKQKPTLTLADASEPDLPKHLFRLLKTEARAMYFDLYKDGITSEIDRTRRRAEVRAQRHRHITKNLSNYKRTGPNYGRK
jgi:hypothetical protein